MKQVKIVYKDGSSIITKAECAWEYENDPDWKETIPVDEGDHE